MLFVMYSSNQLHPPTNSEQDAGVHLSQGLDEDDRRGLIEYPRGRAQVGPEGKVETVKAHPERRPIQSRGAHFHAQVCTLTSMIFKKYSKQKRHMSTP